MAKPSADKHSFVVGDFEYTAQPLPVGPDASAEEITAALHQAMDDCPECRAARARGETPTMISGRDLLREVERLRGAPLRDDRVRWRDLKRPRWRDLKRQVRRG